MRRNAVRNRPAHGSPPVGAAVGVSQRLVKVHGEPCRNRIDPKALRQRRFGRAEPAAVYSSCGTSIAWTIGSPLSIDRSALIQAVAESWPLIGYFEPPPLFDGSAVTGRHRRGRLCLLGCAAAGDAGPARRREARQWRHWPEDRMARRAHRRVAVVCVDRGLRAALIGPGRPCRPPPRHCGPRPGRNRPT